MNSVELGYRIAEFRKKNNMSQADLAEVLNISNKTISRWETGEGYPEISMIEPLSNVLGISIDHLLTGCEPNASYKEILKLKKSYKHISRPVDWPNFWKDLNIFNKIAFITICTGIVGIVFIFLFIYASTLRSFSLIEQLMFMDGLFLFRIYRYSVFLARAGSMVALLGLLLGTFDLYDRQEKASINMFLFNALIGLVLPNLLLF